MEIIITDLTRFSNPDIVCIAGIDTKTNECIRPLPYVQLASCKVNNILPGNVIKGDFTTKSPLENPHTEDHDYPNINESQSM